MPKSKKVSKFKMKNTRATFEHPSKKMKSKFQPTRKSQQMHNPLRKSETKLQKKAPASTQPDNPYNKLHKLRTESEKNVVKPKKDNEGRRPSTMKPRIVIESDKEVSKASGSNITEVDEELEIEISAAKNKEKSKSSSSVKEKVLMKKRTRFAPASSKSKSEFSS